MEPTVNLFKVPKPVPRHLLPLKKRSTDSDAQESSTPKKQRTKENAKEVITVRIAIPEGGREFVYRSRAYVTSGELIFLDDDVDGDGRPIAAGGSAGALLDPEPEYTDVVSCGTLRRTPTPFSKRTLNRFLEDATGRGAPMEPEFLNNTEIHIICRRLLPLINDSLVGHYTPQQRALEHRAYVLNDSLFEAGILPRESFLVGLSSAFNQRRPSRQKFPRRLTYTFPEAKDEGFRQRNLEIGHAMASMAYAAAQLGWEVRLLSATLGFAPLSSLMGLWKNGALANDMAVAALLVFPSSAIAKGALDLDIAALRRKIMATMGEKIMWHGFPDTVHTLNDSEIIHGRYVDSEGEEVMRLRRMIPGLTAPSFRYPSGATLHKAMRSRSSGMAVDFDGAYRMELSHFLQFLCRCCHENLAEGDVCFPHGVLPWSPRTNLFFFVNGVQGLEQGLYCFVRDVAHMSSLKASVGRSEYCWAPVEWPVPFPEYFSRPEYGFYLLLPGNIYSDAPTLQHFLDRSSFFVAVAPGVHELEGGRKHARQFWEAGFLGELLIVEAQAQGITASIVHSRHFAFWDNLLGFGRGNGRILSLYAVGKRSDVRMRT